MKLYSFIFSAILLLNTILSAQNVIFPTNDNDKESVIVEDEKEVDDNDSGDEIVNDDEIAAESLLNEAFSHLGTRYRYGSKGPSTFDCSGFTSYVYRHQTGTEIGCSSRDQYARNQPVERSDMQPGDLVFFTGSRRSRHVGHVGIVVDYDPQTDKFSFIHASIYDGVKVSKSTDSYYVHRFVGVRRVK